MIIDLLKRRPVYVTILLVIVLAMVWYFAWWTPEGNKLTTVNADIASKQQTITQLNIQIIALQHETLNNAGDTKYQGIFSNALPPGPEFDTLTESIYQLSLKTGTQLSQFTADTMSPVSGTALPYSLIPVAMNVTGSEQQVENFIKGMYAQKTIPRLVTISQLSLSGGSGVNYFGVNPVSPAVTFTATIQAEAYTTFIPANG